jgi:hypothetical protein
VKASRTALSQSTTLTRSLVDDKLGAHLTASHQHIIPKTQIDVNRTYSMPCPHADTQSPNLP